MEDVKELELPEWVRQLDAILLAKDPDIVLPPKKGKKKQVKSDRAKRESEPRKITGRFIFEIDQITKIRYSEL